MKEIFYDWGGANIWLFHAINDIRFAWLDKLMLLGTGLGDHNLFPFYLSLLTLFALVRANQPGQDAAHYRVQVNRWMAVIAVFSLAYLLDAMLLGMLKPLLDFPRPPLALPQGSVQIIGVPEYPSQPAERAFIVCNADHGQPVACNEPQLARGRRVVCVVGRDFQNQSGRAFPGGCRGGISIESDRGVAGLCRHTEADAVDRNLNDASRYNSTGAYSASLDDTPDEHRASEQKNCADPPVFGIEKGLLCAANSRPLKRFMKLRTPH